jgi:hypothetical protein
MDSSSEFITFFFFASWYDYLGLYIYSLRLILCNQSSNIDVVLDKACCKVLVENIITKRERVAMKYNPNATHPKIIALDPTDFQTEL